MKTFETKKELLEYLREQFKLQVKERRFDLETIKNLRHSTLAARAWDRAITAISSNDPQEKANDFHCDTGIVIRITNMQKVHNDDDIEEEHSYWHELARYDFESYDQEINILLLALDLRMGFFLDEI
jgi:hypothetical protein